MKDFVIKCGTLIDGTGRDAVHNASILIKNGRIARIETQKSELDNYEHVIDARGKTVMPGIIDAHKHIMNDGGSGVGVGLTLKQIKENIKQIYSGGVTSVIDLGSANLMRFVPKLPMRQPRIFNAITILTCVDGYPGEYMERKYYKLGGR